MKEQDIENVFEIRKQFKFGSELQEFIKTKEKATSKEAHGARPVSAYTNNLMDTINDKFNRIVT